MPSVRYDVVDGGSPVVEKEGADICGCVQPLPLDSPPLPLLALARPPLCSRVTGAGAPLGAYGEGEGGTGGAGSGMLNNQIPIGNLHTKSTMEPLGLSDGKLCSSFVCGGKANGAVV